MDRKWVTTFAVVWIEMTLMRCTENLEEVTTFAVVWIEIYEKAADTTDKYVTTFAVVWIEIVIIRQVLKSLLSPPSRWCGLK